MPRLLLVNPSNVHKGLGNIKTTSWPPLNLPYLAAMTPQHYQIEVLDENIELFQYRDADIVGITAFTSNVNRGYQIAQIYSQKGIPTIMGGIHVSMMPDEALRYCDSVVIGEAESVWPQVLKDFEAGQLKKKYNGTWLGLENLSQPRRDLLHNHHYSWGSIQTSRGCPMDCTFCSVTAFNGRRFRRRPLDDVIKELETIPQRLITITDDNIIGYGQKERQWAYAFFSRIVEKKIKKFFFAQASISFGEDKTLLRLASKAGLRIIFVGMESVNRKTLESYNKNLNLTQLNLDRYAELINNIRKAGITFLGAFILGGDEDERSIFHSTLEFIKSSQIDVLQVTKPTPLPGTKFWDKLQGEKRILNQNFPAAWDDYRFTKLVFEPAQMSIEEVYEGFTYLRRHYYSLREKIKRTLSTLITTKSLTATIIAYKFNTSYEKAFRNSDHYRKYNRPGLSKKFTPQSGK